MPLTLEAMAALVTGGAKRVGRAIVLELARAGCDVAIHYRRGRAEAQQLADEVDRLETAVTQRGRSDRVPRSITQGGRSQRGRQAVIIGADLTDPASWPMVIDETVKRLGRLDILINNASVFLTPQPDSIEAFDATQWESMFRVNLIAPMALCHHAQPHLERGGQGHIVNLCDISARSPWPDHLAYCTSKAALEALTRGLARAMAPDVRVNGVAPGIAVFPDEYPEELRRRLIGKVPLGRPGTPEDVARLVRFLVESGDYITGQIIPIDGGRSLV